MSRLGPEKPLSTQSDLLISNINGERDIAKAADE